LDYTIRRDQEKQEGLKLNGTHQLVAYAEDVNIVRAIHGGTQKLYQMRVRRVAWK
jgi:hypothetical protein